MSATNNDICRQLSISEQRIAGEFDLSSIAGVIQ
jgi:hypothetical protein